MLSYCLARQHLHVASGGGGVAVGNQQNPAAGMKGGPSPGPGTDGFAGQVGRRRQRTENDNKDEDDEDDEDEEDDEDDEDDDAKLCLFGTLHA